MVFKPSENPKRDLHYSESWPVCKGRTALIKGCGAYEVDSYCHLKHQGLITSVKAVHVVILKKRVEAAL
jgi:hypothetical protein